MVLSDRFELDSVRTEELSLCSAKIATVIEGGGSVLLEDVSAAEATLRVEEVVD
jgi:hypothetical protein